MLQRRVVTWASAVCSATRHAGAPEPERFEATWVAKRAACRRRKQHTVQRGPAGATRLPTTHPPGHHHSLPVYASLVLTPLARANHDAFFSRLGPCDDCPLTSPVPFPPLLDQEPGLRRPKRSLPFLSRRDQIAPAQLLPLLLLATRKDGSQSVAWKTWAMAEKVMEWSRGSEGPDGRRTPPRCAEPRSRESTTRAAQARASEPLPDAGAATDTADASIESRVGMATRNDTAGRYIQL